MKSRRLTATFVLAALLTGAGAPTTTAGEPPRDSSQRAAGFVNPAPAQPVPPVPGQDLPASGPGGDPGAPQALSGQDAGPAASSLMAPEASFATMADYLAYLLTDIDGYWTSTWVAAGYGDPSVYYSFPGPGELFPTGCYSPQPRENDDRSAFYCALDDTIVFSQVMATDIWYGRVRANQDPETGVASGDFSVAYVMAHEYAHNLQAESGLLASPERPFQTHPQYKLELHADCWAGVWAKSAELRGLLEPGDLQEGQQAARLAGDYAVTEAGHHGTPQQRVDAFTSGYDAGSPAACDSWLTTAY